MTTAMTSFGRSLLDADEAIEVKKASTSRGKVTVKLRDGFVIDAKEEVAIQKKAAVRPWVKVGLGKPLSMTIEHCYLGNFPGPGGTKPLLLTSTVKDGSQFTGQPRAVNAVKKSQRHKQSLEFHATEDGTRTIYYSPAQSEERFGYTVELTIDRFNATLANKISGLLGTAAGLPVFTVGGQFALAAASQVVKIAAAGAEAGLDGEPYFQSSSDIVFEIAGHRNSQASRIVLARNAEQAATLKSLKFLDGGFELVDRETDAPYRGDLPYVVISVDGRAKPSLADWRATAATSDQLSQFLDAEDDADRTVDAIADGLKLYSDVRIRDRIVKEQRALQQMKPRSAERATQQKKIDALKKQIQTEEIKKLIG